MLFFVNLFDKTSFSKINILISVIFYSPFIICVVITLSSCFFLLQCPLDLNFSNETPATLHLVEGSGPVYISAQHLVGKLLEHWNRVLKISEHSANHNMCLYIVISMCDVMIEICVIFSFTLYHIIFVFITRLQCLLTPC